MESAATGSGLHWYAATTRSCQERKVASALESMGVEHFLPVQKVARRWSDRVKMMDRLVLPRFIFIRTTEAERVRPLENIPALCRYLSNGGPYNPVVIPDAQMDAFRRMVEFGEDKVVMTDSFLAPGDKVRIVSGPLKGLECELVTVRDKHCIAVRMGLLGAATLEVSRNVLEKI